MRSLARPHVVVAGAGVLGGVCALALKRAGASVIWLDPAFGRDGPTTPNASAVAAGMLAPAFETLFDPESPPFDLMRRARDLWPDLAASAGVALDRQGALAVGTAGQVEAWAAALAARDIDREILGPARVAALAPWLAGGGHAVLTGEDWRLSAPAALAALYAAARDLGVAFRAGAVAGWAGGAAILSGRAALAADALVIATGASAALRDAAPELAALTPVKGHILRLVAPLAGPVTRLEGLYVCPDAEGALVGATMEPGIADAAVDPAVAGALAERLRAVAPGLAAGPFEPRAGVRAATPDGLPLAGPSATPGVWLATGARRNGWLLAPLVAGTVTRAILGQTPPPWASSLDPRRFTPPH